MNKNQMQKKMNDIAKVAGKAPMGWDATTYRNFKQANPNLEPDREDTRRMLQATPKARAVKAVQTKPVLRTVKKNIMPATAIPLQMKKVKKSRPLNPGLV